MKGLLLKDLYMMKTCCRSFLLVVVVFLAVSFAGEETVFFRAYPTVLIGMLPITLLSYEEREKWDRYTCALPLRKAVLVGEKYLLGLLLVCAVFLLTLLAELFASGIGSKAALIPEYSWIQLAAALVMPALTLPFVFALGAEKGRIMFYVAIGLICAGLAVLVRSSKSAPEALALLPGWPVVPIAAALYAISCFLSVRLYCRREI